jgi:hypothetical protein
MFTDQAPQPETTDYGRSGDLMAGAELAFQAIASPAPPTKLPALSAGTDGDGNAGGGAVPLMVAAAAAKATAAARLELPAPAGTTNTSVLDVPTLSFAEAFAATVAASEVCACICAGRRAYCCRS